MSVKVKLGILISGRGSNMQAIAEACVSGEIQASVECVISDKATASGLEVAKSMGIKTFLIPKKRLEFEKEALEILISNKVDLVCLAGFMQILSAQFILKFKDGIINIHPSLLPSFKGLHAQKQAIEAGVKFSGCTVHYVAAEIDAGKIIAQRVVPISENETEDALSDKIIKEEHVCYKEALKQLIGDFLIR